MTKLFMLTNSFKSYMGRCAIYYVNMLANLITNICIGISMQHKCVRHLKFN